jgi:hypothetical protein
MRFAGLIIIFFACFSGVTAQDMSPDTILYLEDVNIYSARINRFAKGQAMKQPTALLARNILALHLPS